MGMKMETYGLTKLLKRFGNIEKGLVETAEKSLRAAAKEYVRGRKEEAERRGFRDTGEMIKNVRATKKRSKESEIAGMVIYSRGTDKKGVRNAEKEFLLHYGVTREKGKGIPASHWVDAAAEKSYRAAGNAMDRVWDEAMHE